MFGFVSTPGVAPWKGDAYGFRKAPSAVRMLPGNAFELVRWTYGNPKTFGSIEMSRRRADLRKVTVERLDRVLVGVGEHAEDVEAVLGEIAPAGEDVGLVLLAALFLRQKGSTVDLQTGIILARDEVDHARDRVGTVDGRRAFAQHFDALDCRKRDLLQVDRAAVEGVHGHAAAVQQDQRAIGAEAAQRGTGEARPRRVTEPVRELVALATVGDQLVDELGGVDDAELIDFLARDHRHRQGRFALDALDR